MKLPRFLTRAFAALAFAAGVAAPAFAQFNADDSQSPRARSESPYFQILSDTEPGFDALPLKDTQVDVTVAGVIADVSVVQTYANAGTTPLEARYVFPGSTRAAVHGLTMTIGGRVVRAKIQAKEQARQTYEAAKLAGKTATLLEEHRPNVFEMKLANILPGDVVQVELRYTELLRPEDGVYEFVYPTVVGPRYVGDSRAEPDDPSAVQPSVGAPTQKAEDWTGTAHLTPGEAPAMTFGFNLRLAAGVPITDLLCPSHPARIAEISASEITLMLDPTVDSTRHANRDVIVRYQLAGGAVHAGLLLSRPAGAEEGYFLAMVQPPLRPEPAMIPPRDYVFIVDVSGSMHGFPLDVTKRLLAGLVGSLREADTFNIVLFAGSASVLAGEPVPATADNLARAIVLLERQQGGGGTNLLPALETALRLPRGAEHVARSLVVVTDGFVAVEAEAFDLVRRKLDSASVFAFGIGTSVNRHLIEGLARAGQGEPFVVTSVTEADTAAAKFRTYIESPVLTQVRVAYPGFEALDVAPLTVPDVFAQRPVVIFGKWRGAATGGVRLEGFSGRGAFSTTLDAATALRIDDSRAIELLWARAQISELEDNEMEGRDSERVAAITKLGLRHGLLTQHTSFVAVDEVVRNPGGQAQAVNQPAALPEGVAASAVGGGAQSVATTPEPATIGLLMIAAMALGWVFWQRRVEARA